MNQMNSDICLKRLGFNLLALSESLSRTTKERDELETQLVLARKAAPYPRMDTLSIMDASRGATNLHLPIQPERSQILSGDYDVVFFWKQCDSALYGRRSDMVMKHLLSSGKVGRVLHFDAPMSILNVERNLKETRPDSRDVPLELRYTLTRWMKGFDSERYLSRQFIYREGASDSLFGQLLPARSAYCDWVVEQMKIAGFDPARTVAWVCPVVWDFPEIATQVPFKAVVADLIDDQRTWKATPEKVSKLDESYRDTLKLADVVFSNCHPLADAFQDYARTNRIHIVPNGTERFDDAQKTPQPPELAGIPHPIIGYAGHLSDRIDWVLLAEVVKARPDWSFVFIGSGHDIAQAIDLAAFKNVHFLGVVEYSRLPQYLHSFDVAIVPHEDNSITKRMNPLKIYNYLSVGLPIVATEIANIDEIRPYLRIANNPKSFVSEIELALKQKTVGGADRKQLMDRINWDNRVAEMLRAIDSKLESRKTGHGGSLYPSHDGGKGQIPQIENKLQDIEQENELLLLQLHQVQEELEHYYLKYQEKENSAAQLSRGSEEHSKLVAELQTQIQKLTQERNQYAKQASECQALLEQLTQAIVV